MSNPGAVLTAGVVAVVALVTLVIFEREPDDTPRHDLHVHIDEAFFDVPRGALTFETNPDDNGSLLASLIVSAPDANAIQTLLMGRLADDEAEYDFTSSASRADGVTLVAEVPTSFEPSSAQLVLVLESGQTMSVALHDEHPLTVVDGARE